MEIEKYEEELLNILESNIQNKELYVSTLADLNPKAKGVIMQAYDTWSELNTLESESPSSSMDNSFYESLSKFDNSRSEKSDMHIVPTPKKASKIFTLQRLGIAMTFMIGLALGGYLDFFGTNDSENRTHYAVNNSGLVKFASIEQTPLASDRIKGIIGTKSHSDLDAKILYALNDVICNDPSINVRLSAIETLVLFWDNPDARKILIKAIPFQNSPIVQLELADIMISLEAKTSSENWNQLLSSNQLEPDIRSQLENTLKEIL